ncbi:hypothetical protein DESC_810170 [Desulfosarcina cetonica]|nr:hypothetical protein DESC_810170 [Desulfosarcina cetonica]
MSNWFSTSATGRRSTGSGWWTAASIFPRTSLDGFVGPPQTPENKARLADRGGRNVINLLTF